MYFAPRNITMNFYIVYVVKSFNKVLWINKLKKKLKQLKFRCWHRGMREMDLLMGGFFDMFQSVFSKEEIIEIEQYIIPLSDNDLYKCFLGKLSWPKEISENLLHMFKTYSKNLGLNNS